MTYIYLVTVRWGHNIDKEHIIFEWDSDKQITTLDDVLELRNGAELHEKVRELAEFKGDIPEPPPGQRYYVPGLMIIGLFLLRTEELT